MKGWARRAPPPNGPIPDGDLAAHLNAERMLVVLMDSNGRAYHVNKVDLRNAELVLLEQPRSAINELMDIYGIEDGPNWSAIED